MALNNRAVTLGQLDRPQEELTAYQQVIDDYRDDPNPALREQVEVATAARDELGVALRTTLTDLAGNPFDGSS